MAAACHVAMNHFWLALVLATCACVALISARAAPILIYNPSNSVHSGFYLRTGGAYQRGDIVTVAAADVAPAYAALRGYADPSDRFLKRIAATAGQSVCASGNVVSIDGAPIAVRIEHDAQGRPLPRWEGCGTLAANEVLLLGDTEDSFDGRYWGPISTDMIEGVWRPLSD